jgi:hypothetical protein
MCCPDGLRWWGTGADQAISWIFAHEGDPVLTQPLPAGTGAPAARPEPVSTFSTASAGVAGILRREQELAASAERCLGSPTLPFALDGVSVWGAGEGGGLGSVFLCECVWGWRWVCVRVCGCVCGGLGACLC